MRRLFIKLFNYLFKGYVRLWKDELGNSRIDICEPKESLSPLPLTIKQIKKDIDKEYVDLSKYGKICESCGKAAYLVKDIQ